MISKIFFSNDLIAYIKILGISVNLSYLSLIFPLAFALFIYSVRDKGVIGIVLSGIAYLPFAFILMLIPSMTGLIFYTITSVTVILYAINRQWYGVDKKQGFLIVIIPVFIVVLLGISVIFFSGHLPYFFNRISALLNPEKHLDYLGYLNFVIRDILSTSVFWGKGKTLNVTSYLPDINTDYSLTYLIHEFGFIMLFLVSALVLVFSIFGLYKAIKEKSALGGIISITIILTFIFQAFSYIIANLGYGVPVSLSLPLISYGNTSLFINSALIGIMLSVFRTGEIHSDTILKNPKPIFTYHDRKFIINFKL